MKKLFIYVLFLFISLNLAAQTEQKQEQKQTQTKSQETPKQEYVYTKDFLTKFAEVLYLEKENPKEALKIYEELFNQAPNDITLLESLSRLCFITNDRTCAEKYVPLYLKEDPQDPQALAYSAQLAWRNGNFKQAQEYYFSHLHQIQIP